MLPSLVVYAIGYGMVAITHLTVHALLYLAGYTVFAWYGKRRCPQYYLCSYVSGRLYRVRLVWQTSAPTILFVV